MFAAVAQKQTNKLGFTQLLQEILFYYFIYWLSENYIY